MELRLEVLLLMEEISIGLKIQKDNLCLMNLIQVTTVLFGEEMFQNLPEQMLLLRLDQG